jgi:hypothetical protein
MHQVLVSFPDGDRPSFPSLPAPPRARALEAEAVLQEEIDNLHLDDLEREHELMLL